MDSETVGRIDVGLMVLVGVERGDDEAKADRLLERLLGYRVFPDETGRMNLSLRDIGGGLLLVPQFTLAADTRKGTRPCFSTAAHPEEGGGCSVISVNVLQRNIPRWLPAFSVLTCRLA